VAHSAFSSIELRVLVNGRGDGLHQSTPFAAATGGAYVRSATAHAVARISARGPKHAPWGHYRGLADVMSMKGSGRVACALWGPPPPSLSLPGDASLRLRAPGSTERTGSGYTARRSGGSRVGQSLPSGPVFTYRELAGGGGGR